MRLLWPPVQAERMPGCSSVKKCRVMQWKWLRSMYVMIRDILKKKYCVLPLILKIHISTSLDINAEDINIVDGFVGSGYGQINDDVRSVIRDMARTEGILLDPVYTAKAFLGLSTLLEKQALEYQNILFIHTGGIFGLYPFKDDLNI